jgi:hypothetical protein
VDDDVNAASPKGYSERDLDAIARTIPEVYDALSSGMPHRQLMDDRRSSDARKRAVGNTYAHVFGMTGASEVLAADLDGGELRVAKGNHRIRAAQRANVPFVPVEVRASSVQDLTRVEADLRARYGSAYERLQEVHRTADADRVAERSPAPGREATPPLRVYADRG